MVDDPIPDKLREFILKHLDSIAQLEALLLLRNNPAEKWTAEKAAKRLYISQAEAVAILDRFCLERLLNCDNDIYRLECADPEDATTIDLLADVYARHIVPVTNLIHSKQRVQKFADAFRVQKDR